MSDGGSRRVVAEIRFGEDRAGVSKVGGRSIHQYWSLLSPHFRDVFLAPQRRSDDGGVSWTWREPSEKKALAAADLTGVRNRLERAKESFQENPVNPLMSEVRGGGASSQEMIDQVATRVNAMADGLITMSDTALMEFVCRTETGVMVHSWGLAAAAKIYYPDSLESGVSGIVMFGGKGSAGNEVVIENAKGLRVARTVTDEAGEFSFSKIAPGRYRVRVISGPGEFSPKGATVNVERGEVTRLELRSTSDPEVPGGETGADEAATSSTSAPLAVKKRRGVILAVVIGCLLLLFGGGVWVWRSWGISKGEGPRNAVQLSSMTPENFSNEKPIAPEASAIRVPGGDGGGLAVAADGVGGMRTQPSMQQTPTVALQSVPLAASASGGGHTASKIGSRVELARVGASTIGGSKASDETVADGSSSDVPAGEAAQSDSFSSDTSGTRSTGEAGSSADIPSGSSAKTDADGLPISNNPKPVGRAAVEALTGHLPAGLGGGGPDSPAGIEKTKKAPLVRTSGSVTTGKAKSGSEDQADGAIGPDKAKAEDPPAVDAVLTGQGPKVPDGAMAMTPTAQVPVVAVTIAEKNATSKQTLSADQSQQTSNGVNRFDPGNANKVSGKKPAKVTGDNQSKGPQHENADEPPEHNEPEAKAVPEGAPLPSGASTLTSSQSSAEKGSGASSTFASEKPTAPSRAETAPDAQTSGKDKPTSPNPKPATTKTASGSPAVLTFSATGGPAAASAEVNAGAEVGDTPQAVSPAAAKSDNSQETQHNGAQQAGEKIPSVEKLEPPSALRTPQIVHAGMLRSVGMIQLSRWVTRMEHDIIVPTMPVLEGAPDATEGMRRKLIEEQKARLPETLKRPSLQCGISFKFAPGVKVQLLEWPSTTLAGVILNIRDGHAEISWDAAAPLHDCVVTLTLGDRTEAARVGFDHEGRTSVELRPELRAALWLGAMYSINDDTRTNNMPRFAWQVLRGPLASSAWFNDGNWLDGAGCRLDVVLNGAPPAHTIVVLVDHVTGWMLATELM